MSSLKKFFFSPESSFNLQVFRLLYFLALILSYLSLWDLHSLFVNSGIYNKIILGLDIDYFSIEFLNVKLFFILRISMLGAFFLSAFAIKLRITKWLSLLLFLLVEYPISSEMYPYSTNVVVAILFVLALALDNEGFSFKDRFKTTSYPIPSWPFKFIKLAIAFTFFNSFVSKIYSAGLSWMDGLALQAHLYERYIFTQNELLGLLTSNIYLCQISAILTIGFEAGLILFIFSKWAERIFPLIACGFILFNYMSMEVNFIRFLGPAFFIFINWEQLKTRVTNKETLIQR